MQKLKLDMDIDKNIRLQRKRCKLTQEDVTAKLQAMGINITRSIYSKIETNTYNIRISELVALKHIFKMNSFDPFFTDLD